MEALTPPTDITRFQAWVLASRPKTLTAAAAPVLAGVGVAAHFHTVEVLPALAALVGALLIQVATNLANDYYDFVRGGATEERVGPVRVTQAGIIPPESVKRGMYVTLGAALLVGVYLAWIGGWPIVALGLASLAAGPQEGPELHILSQVTSGGATQLTVFDAADSRSGSAVLTAAAAGFAGSATPAGSEPRESDQTLKRGNSSRSIPS